MNEANEAVKVAESLWQQLIHAPSHLLWLLALLVIGVMWKASPFSNRLIPFALIVIGAVGYPFLTSPRNVDPSFPHPGFVLSIYGALLGFGTIITHILLKRSAKFCAIEDAIVNTFSRNGDAAVKPASPTVPPVDYP